ncbi:MAG: nitroreductase family protein [Desulfobacteraceae bacterium]|nr:nitroreductase family protein [Desulfobacteraceae bacterium]
MENNANILLKLATDRKTVRRFKQTMPSDEDIQQALKTACQAPSGSNARPWRFLIINDPIIKTRIRQAAEEGEKVFYESIDKERRNNYKAMGHSWKKPMLENAPVLIVVLSDMSAPNFKPSVWLSVGYIVLALEAVGISSVTYTPSDHKKVEAALKIPEGFQIETIIPIGYSNDPKKKGPRKALTEVTYINKWGTTQII